MDYQYIAEILDKTAITVENHWARGEFEKPDPYSYDGWNYCEVGAMRKAMTGNANMMPGGKEYIESLRLVRKEMRRRDPVKWLIMGVIGIRFFSLRERYERQIFIMNDNMMLRSQIISATQRAAARAARRSRFSLSLSLLSSRRVTTSWQQGRTRTLL